MSDHRIYLKVPFLQKDIVKGLGAHFDFQKKSWYIEDHQDPSPFMTWLIPKQSLKQGVEYHDNDEAKERIDSSDHTHPTDTDNEGLLPPAISLLYLMQMVKQSVQQRFAQPIWIHAEIAQIKQHRQHHYLELVQRGEHKGEELAKIRATIWASQQNIITQFEQQTGKQLVADLKVMLHVCCVFHERFGLSLNIIGISAEYTLGEMQRKINAIRKKLKNQGIYANNKEKTLPTIINKICVISPEKAAGLADFQHYLTPLIDHQLCQCDYYHVVFQGEKASQYIAECLQHIAKQCSIKNYQLIVILRGGGSLLDLQYLEEYEINEQVCLSPIPVWVGLGHQSDQLLINEMAHRHFPTPTAVAKQIIDDVLSPLKQAINQWQAITQLSRQHLSKEDQKLQYYRFQLQQYGSRVIHTKQQQLSKQKGALEYHTMDKVMAITYQLQAYYQSIYASAKQHLQRHQYLSNQLFIKLKEQSTRCIKDYQATLSGYHQLIQHTHPQNILKRGFAIVRDKDNQPLKALTLISQQEKIIIEMHKGFVEATVNTSSQQIKKEKK